MSEKQDAPMTSQEPSEADVKAARRVLLDQACEHMEGCPSECFEEWVVSFSRALASARFEGGCEMLDRLRNSLKFWPEDGCDIGVATEVARLLSSARAEGEAAGAAQEREAVARWLDDHARRSRREGDMVGRLTADLFAAVVGELLRGDHIRALSSEETKR